MGLSSSIALAALAAILAGCTGPGAIGRTSTEAQDQELFALLEPDYPLAVGDDETRSLTKVVALQGCDALDSGSTTDEVFAGVMEGTSLADADIITTTAAATVIAGIRTYCPEYKSEMIETVEGL